MDALAIYGPDQLAKCVINNMKNVWAGAALGPIVGNLDLWTNIWRFWVNMSEQFGENHKT